VAREVTATVASGTVLALGKAAVNKIKQAKHDDGAPPPSGQTDTPAD
jgi:hypothetical protein